MVNKISIGIDKRRKLKDGRYPIKLRIRNLDTGFDKRYATNLNLYEEDYKKAWGRAIDKVPKTHIETHKVISNIFKRAKDTINSLDYFEDEVFQRKFYRKLSDKTSAVYHFNKTIDEFDSKQRFGAASSYRCALTSIMKFQATKGQDTLDFNEVSPKWLEEYEEWMSSQGRSITTIAIYTRSLRVMFNNAIRDKDLDGSVYPFGKGKYEIPEEVKVKKALTRQQVKMLNDAALPPLQEKARDYWLFSYSCNGMNFKDIALLRYKDLGETELSYYREKTRIKKRKGKKKIVVPYNKMSNWILQKYRSNYANSDDYVFPILSAEDSAEEIYRKVKNFTRAINQQLKHIAKALDFPPGFSSYWARHSYATNMIQVGASIEFVSEALNHSDIKVTQHYFDGFEDETKRELTDKLMSI